MNRTLRLNTVLIFALVLLLSGCGSSKKDSPSSSPAPAQKRPAPPPVDCHDYVMSIYYLAELKRDKAPDAMTSAEGKHIYRSGQLMTLMTATPTFFGGKSEFTQELQERFLKIYDSIVNDDGDLRDELVHSDEEACKDR